MRFEGSHTVWLHSFCGPSVFALQSVTLSVLTPRSLYCEKRSGENKSLKCVAGPGKAGGG